MAWVGISKDRAGTLSLGQIMKTPCFPKPKAREQSCLQGLGFPGAVLHVEQVPCGRGGSRRSLENSASRRMRTASCKPALLSLYSVAPGLGFYLATVGGLRIRDGAAG